MGGSDWEIVGWFDGLLMRRFFVWVFEFKGGDRKGLGCRFSKLFDLYIKLVDREVGIGVFVFWN